MHTKNLLKISLILSILFVFNFTVSGQHQFGIKASGGISRIYGLLELRNHPTSTKSTTFSPSIQAGLYYHFPMGKKCGIGAETLFSQVEGEQAVEWDYKGIGSSNIDGYGSDFTHEKISYFSLPVYFGYTYQKLTINGGFQISYAFSSSGRNESSYVIIITDEGDRMKREGGLKRELNDLTIKDFDFGPRVGVIYRLTNQLSIEGMFYYGISNINQIKMSAEELKIQQMTLGIRYSLWSDFLP